MRSGRRWDTMVIACLFLSLLKLKKSMSPILVLVPATK
jgi:hypothetical protein